MKKLEKYESPLVDIVDVEVEKGFAASAGSFGNGDTDGWQTNQFEGLLNDLQSDINELGKYF